MYCTRLLQDTSGALHEVEPVCVLDFYVHESRQRTGCGKKLFEAMLEVRRIEPRALLHVVACVCGIYR